MHLLGMGGFADVSVCEYRGQTYVLKQITYAIDRTQGRDLNGSISYERYRRVFESENIGF